MAKKKGHDFVLVPMIPNFRTMNEYFVKKGETFPFCDFLKPYICFFIKQRFPDLEIIFNYRFEIVNDLGIDDLIKENLKFGHIK